MSRFVEDTFSRIGLLVFFQETDKLTAMLLLIGQKRDAHVLRHEIEPVAQPNDLLILGNGCLFRIDDAFDDRDYIRGISGWLQRSLPGLELHAPRNNTIDGFDSVCQLRRVIQFFGDVCTQRFLDFFCTDSVKVNTVGDVIDHGLKLHEIRFDELLNNGLVLGLIVHLAAFAKSGMYPVTVLTG